MVLCHYVVQSLLCCTVMLLYVMWLNHKEVHIITGGTFLQPIKIRETVIVGYIPVNKRDVYIALESKADVDIQVHVYCFAYKLVFLCTREWYFFVYRTFSRICKAVIVFVSLFCFNVCLWFVLFLKSFR